MAHSPWLRERYGYEKLHYGHAYEFEGDVEEMKEDFSHYVFTFHDEFVEALCAGIWFETADECIGNREYDSTHPFLDLPSSSISNRFETHGIVCQVRQNSSPVNELIKNAAFCSQKLLQVALEHDGSATVMWTVSLRVRGGRTQAYLKSGFGKVEETYDNIPTLDDVRPRIEEWLEQTRGRRKQMGSE